MKDILPAIDLRDGKVVRLVKGIFSDETIYSHDPLFTLNHFISLGARWIHIVNLDGAKDGKFEETSNFNMIKLMIKVAKENGIKVQIGGGIRNEKTIKNLISIGVNRVILGTMAIEQPEITEKMVRKFSKKIAIGLDVENNKIKTRGWKKNTEIKLKGKFLELQNIGVTRFIITDITKDGTGDGTNNYLYAKIMKHKSENVKIIASGGIKNSIDLVETLSICDGVIVGRAIYSKTITDQELRNLFLKLNPTNLIRRIIPCLDVKDSRVVKGVKFINLKDSGDPVELARYYNNQGADEIVFLDISATLEGRKSMFSVIKQVAEEIFIPLTVGGGIRTVNDMTEIIKAGAEKIAINSSAIKNPDLISQGAKKFGSQCIVVAIDVKKEGSSWRVYINAGTKATDLDAIEWAIEAVRKGAGELLVTSMDQDGTNLGYDLKLFKTLTSKVNVPVIASGGAGTYQHFKQAIDAGAEAVLAASLFHYNKMKISDLKEYLDECDIAVRLN
jgi:cyclase